MIENIKFLFNKTKDGNNYLPDNNGIKNCRAVIKKLNNYCSFGDEGFCIIPTSFYGGKKYNNNQYECEIVVKFKYGNIENFKLLFNELENLKKEYDFSVETLNKGWVL